MFTDRILLTGARGVLGRRIPRALRAAGFDGQVVSFEGDVGLSSDVDRFLSAGPRFSACLHLAAVVSLVSVDADPLRAYRVNALGPGILAERLARTSPGCHLLHCSTSHVYRPSERALSEDAPTDPPNVYGRSKLAGERIIGEVAALGGLSLGIARVFSMYAEDQHSSFLYPSVRARFDVARPGGSVTVRGARNVRDFLHADEVAAELARLVVARASGVINVASGRPTTVLEFVRSVAPPGIEVAPDEDDRSEPNSIYADVGRLESLHDYG